MITIMQARLSCTYEWLYIWTEEQAIDDHDDDAKKRADDKVDM